MKSHDFGQFLFNASIFNELQISQVIRLSEKSKPTLATESLFLRLVSAAELTKILMTLTKEFPEFPIALCNAEGREKNPEFVEKYDNLVKELITPKQAKRAADLKDGQSLWLAQGMTDGGIVNFAKLDRILAEYRRLEIPPLEESFAAYYDDLRGADKIDYPLALDVTSAFHDFLSATFGTSIILLPPAEIKEEKLFGASVKINGAVPVVTGFLADEKTFVRAAAKYNAWIEKDSLEDSFDAMSELLNVFTGHFTIKMAASLGLEEEPEPPRFGRVEKNSGFVKMLADFGNFYVYVGNGEIFDGDLTDF